MDWRFSIGPEVTWAAVVEQDTNGQISKHLYAIVGWTGEDDRDRTISPILFAEGQFQTESYFRAFSEGETSVSVACVTPTEWAELVRRESAEREGLTSSS